jgi:hypothetical protein
MKKLFFCLSIALVLLCVLVSSEPGYSSQPVRATIIGCVVEGLFISRESTLYTDHGPRTSSGSHYIRVSGIEVTRYEGQTLRLAGFLSPGDRFVTNEQNLEVLSPSCDVASIPRFKLTFSWACRTLARERFSAKAYEEASKYINRAIETDPAECEFYLTRSEIYQAEGRSDMAAEDVRKAAGLGCGK